ncbi:MAG: glycoside hydrolase family 25 protein [Lachnospiraceae bacterium]|nr:glycoside hydrolase family 25 protein [Lachnospiraceae bacterium]
MRQTDDFEDNSGGLPIIYMALGVSVFILAVLGIVLAINKKPVRNTKPVVVVEESSEENSSELIASDKRTADDLDIWNMYPEETEEETTETESETEEETTTEESKDDGNHIQIVYSDGSEEWVKINPYMEKNTYDFTNLVSNDGKMKYYSDGKKISYLGVDISRYQKDVDFEALKSDGIDFVMLRVGARGYKTGEIQIDEYFHENIKKATEAGLDIGVYFFSQAVTQEEAIEEAQLVLDNIKEYEILYPIAYDMEFIENDTARVETLTRDERTTVAAAFLNHINNAGYTPMLYGDTEWLVKRIDVAKFNASCIWLAEEADIPKYPYRYEMWQYTTQGQVRGINGFVDLNISFVDYSAR